MKTRCPECGTKMELIGSSFTRSASPLGGDGKLELQAVCPNPDCPGADSDLAPAAPGQ